MNSLLLLSALMASVATPSCPPFQTPWAFPFLKYQAKGYRLPQLLTPLWGLTPPPPPTAAALPEQILISELARLGIPNIDVSLAAVCRWNWVLC